MSYSIHANQEMIAQAVGSEASTRASAISAERLRAQSAESLLSGRVTACETSGSTNAAAIVTEKTRAEAAETTIAAAVAANAAAIETKIAISAIGRADGVAGLGEDGKIPASQLPGFVDEVLEYDSLSAFPEAGESGKIYIAKDTNKTYRWSGTAYTIIGGDLALGETSGTAYRGDRGKTAYDHSQATGVNPHGVTWDSLAGTKPTTLDGYGITDAARAISTDELGEDSSVDDIISKVNDLISQLKGL